MTLEELRDYVRAVNIDILVLESIYELEEILVEYNTDRLFTGRKADGTFMPDYSESSVMRGKPEGPIRLWDKGNFYSGFYVVRTGGYPIVISSRDEKTFMLIEKYGEEIFGLDQGDLDNFNTEYLLEVLSEKIRIELGL